jgi:UTP-glucose-1-phosphate uridylyltransferase
MKPILVILAAGMGSRYGGLKQVDEMGPSGETIMEYSIYDAIRAGFGKVVFIIREDIEEAFKAKFFHKIEGKIDIAVAYQNDYGIPTEVKALGNRTKPWGTGHAVLSAYSAVDAPFAVINADDFYGYEAYKLMYDFLKDVKPSEGKYAMVGYRIKNVLSDFGAVSRGVCKADSNGFLEEIVERKTIQRTEKGIEVLDDPSNTFTLEEDQLVSMNFFGLTPHIFPHLLKDFTAFCAANREDVKAEFYIQVGITNVIKSGEASMKLIGSDAPWFGVTYKEDKPLVMAAINDLVKKGDYPSNLWA